MLLDPPRTLPVGHLSPSSISLWQKSQVRWKKRYIDNLFEPSSPSALLGTAVGGAELQHFGRIVDGHPGLSTDDVLDAMRDRWQLELDVRGDNVVWDERPGRVLDSGRKVLPVYHRLVAPTVKPIAIERGFELRFPGLEWTFQGFIDVEEVDRLPEVKTRSRSRGPVSIEEADTAIQATSYLAARRAEGEPASSLDYHWLVRAAKGGTSRPSDVGITRTHRTDDQLDQFLQLIFKVAAQIDFAATYDVWTPPADGVWWCSREWCGFWGECEFGGLHRPPTAGRRPQPARRLPDADVYAAIAATKRKTNPDAGTTTAAKVAAYLGVSRTAAAARLRALPDVYGRQPTKSSGRGKEKVTVSLPGPKVYWREDPVEADLEASVPAVT